MTSGAGRRRSAGNGRVLFFLIPRFTTGYLSALNLQPSLMTGFSDNVELGQIGEIKKNPAVVMRIPVDGDPARAQTCHWRGIVLTNFDGRRWTTPGRTSRSCSRRFHERLLPRRAGTSRADELLPPALHRADGADRHRRDLRRAACRKSSPAVSARTSPVRAGSLQRPGYLLVDPTGSFFNPVAQQFRRFATRAASRLPQVPPAELRKSPRTYPDAIRGTYLQLPPLDPRIPQLARDRLPSDARPMTTTKPQTSRATSVTHYAYTLDLSGPQADDPLANFLFVRRSGHCEYFASAMTVMLRSHRHSRALRHRISARRVQ